VQAEASLDSRRVSLPISSDTKHDHLRLDLHLYILTPQQHTTPYFNSKQQHDTKWPAEKVRLPTFPSRRAARARKDVSTDTFFTGKTGGKTGGKAGGDTTGKTQKSHSAKAGLQVRYGMRSFRDGTEARSGSSDGFARVDFVRAEFARCQTTRDRNAMLSTRLPRNFQPTTQLTASLLSSSPAVV
jgi:hypothetical protein